jgi:hypothetical protein
METEVFGITSSSHGLEYPQLWPLLGQNHHFHRFRDQARKVITEKVQIVCCAAFDLQTVGFVYHQRDNNNVVFSLAPVKISA